MTKKGVAHNEKMKSQTTEQKRTNRQHTPWLTDNDIVK